MSEDATSARSFAIGLSLAVSSSVFIGASFVIKKVALRRLAATGGLRASHGGYAYLRQWLWWLGLLTMGVGEAANLLAYAWAPAALVTPLGALSVLVAAVLASKFLDEHLTRVGKLGCALCVPGAVVVVLHAPASPRAVPFGSLVAGLCAPAFLVYAGGVLAATLAAGLALAPRLGERHVAVYLSVCSAVGSLTVVLCKTVAEGARESLANLAHPAYWPLLLAAAACVAVQMNYLNRSLDAFGAGLVTPVYYVMFTSLSLLSSALALGEWRGVGWRDAAGLAAGLLVLVSAVFMLHASAAPPAHRAPASPPPSPRRRR